MPEGKVAVRRLLPVALPAAIAVTGPGGVAVAGQSHATQSSARPQSPDFIACAWGHCVIAV
jgi:hypothetical protein